MNDYKVIQLDEKVLEIEKMTNNLKEAEVKEIYKDSSYSHFIATCKGEIYMPLRYSARMTHKKFKFDLDGFQEKAISCIVKDQSVIVSAHTSGGKTAIAEYAIAKCLKEMKNVIYTSPIKALTNQKYMDFSKEFRDVGIITGDVNTNRSARCLVMTTEILHSMLYNKSPELKSVGWVIFDEAQYINDRERGVAWEETIIMMPRNIRCVFLSATISNAVEFAKWVTVTTMQPCHVIISNIRPIPLVHYVSPFTKCKFTLAMGSDDIFKKEEVKNCLPFYDGFLGFVKSYYVPNYREIVQIMKILFAQPLPPVILFTFNIQMIEKFSKDMINLNFNTPEETEHVTKLYENYLASLSIEDRNVQQVRNFLPLLKNGIGIHHSGLLPILREIIEILFAKGLVKFLFATESVSLGLNLPAKTVVFLTPKKFDSNKHRYITSGEYIQMSGRAGRRGTDDIGISILLVNFETKVEDLEGIYKSVSEPLKSAFRITYNMLLSLLNIGNEPKKWINKSFCLFQQASNFQEKIQRVKIILNERKPSLEQELIQLKTEIENLRCVKLLHNLNARKDVLYKLGYIDNNGHVTVKGRIFQELRYSDELLLTEMLYGGKFDDMEPASICSVLSCFLAERVRTETKFHLTGMFATLYFSITEVESQIEKTAKNEFEVIKKTEDYSKSRCTNLMKAVYDWTNGASFQSICSATDATEGNIVRTIKRIHELLKYMMNATDILNNPSLEQKFAQCIKAIQRGIVFAPSLHK